MLNCYCNFSTDLELSKYVKKHLTTKRYKHFSKFKVCYFLKNKLIFKDFKFFRFRHFKWHFRDRVLFSNFLNVNIKKRFYLFGLQSACFIKNSFGVPVKAHLIKSLLLKKQVFLKRLDIVLWQSGFCTSLTFVRQLILHGFFSVNGKCVTFCNFLLKKGDIVSLSSKCDYYQRALVCKTKFIYYSRDRFFHFLNDIVVFSFDEQNFFLQMIDECFDDIYRNCRRLQVQNDNRLLIKLKRDLNKRLSLNNVDAFYLSFYYFGGVIGPFLFLSFFIKLFILNFKIISKLSIGFLKKLFFIFFNFCFESKKSVACSLLNLNNLKSFDKKVNLVFEKVEFFTEVRLLLLDIKKNYSYLILFYEKINNVFSEFWISFTEFYSGFVLHKKLDINVVYGVLLSNRLKILNDEDDLIANLNRIKQSKVPFLLHKNEYHYSYARDVSLPFYPYESNYNQLILYFSLCQNIHYLKNINEFDAENVSLFSQFQKKSVFLKNNEEDLNRLLDTSSFLKLFYYFSVFFKKYKNVEVDYSFFRFIFLDLSSDFLKNTMLMQNLIIVFLLRFYKI